MTTVEIGNRWIGRRCWLAPFDVRGRECRGREDCAHLIAQQVLRREGLPRKDRRSYVQGCRLHHGEFDNYGAVVVPRASLPEGTEEFAAEVGLGWWLDRRYGPKA